MLRVSSVFNRLEVIELARADSNRFTRRAMKGLASSVSPFELCVTQKPPRIYECMEKQWAAFVEPRVAVTIFQTSENCLRLDCQFVS